MTIKAILFDFGNVVYGVKKWVPCREFSEYSPYSSEEVFDMIYRGGIEKNLDNGGTFEEFYARTMAAIEADASRLTPELFRHYWNGIFRLTIDDMGKLLASIDPGIKKILVANTNVIHWEDVIRDLPLIKEHFPDESHWSLSFQIGHRKPHIKHFKDAVQKAGCTPPETLFIDDKEKFVRAYEQKFNGNGILWNGSLESVAVLERKMKYYL